MTKPKYPQSDALELARINAIRLLGLHEHNTPEDRAKAMGYAQDVYHGSKQDLQGGFKPGYDDNLSFVTPKPEFANNWIGKGRYTERLGDEAKAERQSANDKYRAMKYKNMDYDSLNNLQGDEFTKEYDRRNALHKGEMKKEFGDMASPDRIHSTVYPMKVRAKKTFNPETDMHHMHEFFAKDKTPQNLIDLYKTGNYMLYETKPVVEYLKSKGFDSMKLRESSDGDYTTVAMFDPAHVRSRFAAFDPARAHEAGLSYANGGNVQPTTTDLDAMKLALMNKGGDMKSQYPTIQEMIQHLQGAGRTPIVPAPNRWFHDPDKHPFQQKMIERVLEQTGQGREGFPSGSYINPQTGEPMDFDIMHDLGVAIDPATGRPMMSGIKSDLTEIDPKYGSITKSNLVRKGLFKHEGGDDLLKNLAFLATIEKSGKGHHYGLSTQYASPAELVNTMTGQNPTLRPHSRGDIFGVGDEVGRISIQGKHHPVYEKLLVAPAGSDVQGRKLHKAKGGTIKDHITITERPL